MNYFQSLCQRVNWRLRLLLGVRYQNDSEMFYRLNRLPESSSGNQVFRFPWGEVEFPSVSDLKGQLSEIFWKRHYAFKARGVEPTIIDAGGNIGISAIWFKQNYPTARVTVYEADPELARVISRNLAAAKISDVHVQHAAVWIHNGFVAFDNLGHDKGAVSLSGKIQVQAVNLALSLPEQVDLLKLDIEGAEYPVIERLCATGAIARVHNLVAEFHVRRTDFDDAVAALRRLREAGMQVAVTSALGGWLGAADSPSAFEVVGRDQILMEVYAWR